MKRLVLLRHAKAIPAAPDFEDRDRRLADRGRSDAIRIGQFLKEENCVPELVLCSTALRTRQTLDLVVPQLGAAPVTRLLPELYLARWLTIVNLVRQVRERAETLMIVGHNPGQLEPLPQLGTLPPTIDAAFDLAEQNNPNLHIAQYTESQSSATAAATRGQGGPTISAFGQGISTNNELLSVGGKAATKRAVAGFTISQPLFSSGLIRSQVREADARNRADQAGIDIARRSVMQSVTSAWVQLSAARVAVTTGQRQVDSAQQAFAGMSCEELNGLRSPIETLNAEEELQSAELQLVQNRYQVYVSHATLLAATGNLSAQQIADNVAVYDPEANFRHVRYAGTTPLQLLASGLDRIGSANPRGPFSTDLAGGNVPHPENAGPLAPAPGHALMNKPLTPITESRLRLPNGDTARCPLNDIRPH